MKQFSGKITFVDKDGNKIAEANGFIHYETPCNFCEGSGRDPYDTMRECGLCGGTGEV